MTRVYTWFGESAARIDELLIVRFERNKYFYVGLTQAEKRLVARSVGR